MAAHLATLLTKITKDGQGPYKLDPWCIQWHNDHAVLFIPNESKNYTVGEAESISFVYILIKIYRK